jgi:hypothetical protein
VLEWFERITPSSIRLTKLSIVYLINLKNITMILTENMRAVIVRIQKSAINPNQISPNFVNELANKMGRDLTSEQVVYISDN